MRVSLRTVARPVTGRTRRPGPRWPGAVGHDGGMTPAANPSVGHVPEAPTLPAPGDDGSRAFDVADLYRGPVAQPTTGDAPPLDEKLRQAYFWIVNQAIISPHYDIEYQQGPNASFAFGDSRAVVDLPSGQSYSSFVLLPLLTFATRRRCLLVGGPGRGKTASAMLHGRARRLLGARRAPGDPARPPADDHRRPAGQPAAGRPHEGRDHRRHPHRLALVAVDAGEDHRRVQPHPDPHPVGAADRDGRQLRRDVRPDLRVPRRRLVPDRQRRRRRRHLPGHRGAARPHRRGGQGAVLQQPLPRRPARPRRAGLPPRGGRARPDRLHAGRARPDARRRSWPCSCRCRSGAGSSSSPASSSSSSRRRPSSSTRPRTPPGSPASTCTCWPRPRPVATASPTSAPRPATASRCGRSRR